MKETMSRNILFISVDTIKERTGLHANVDEKLVMPEILTAQDMYILPALGTGLYDRLQDGVAANNLTADDVAWLVPHQANLRIIDATANRMGVDKSKVMINIDHFGNTTNGTIPLLLWEWESQLKKGDNLILAAFGGGFTWGAIYLKWAY